MKMPDIYCSIASVLNTLRIFYCQNNGKYFEYRCVESFEITFGMNLFKNLSPKKMPSTDKHSFLQNFKFKFQIFHHCMGVPIS